ncbi:hypothetical protein HID58_017572 [Brassica napus]|uniref:Uncharacterized protein n=1 Tax=Brassica napus TaxID=3708 RepID=A0ABQ8D7K0_BRANA|nr:hypothetical protein HID58_017572 [Brassica napus]
MGPLFSNGCHYRILRSLKPHLSSYFVAFTHPLRLSPDSPTCLVSLTLPSRRRKIPACSSINNGDDAVEETRSDDEEEISPLPLLLVATLPGAGTVRSVIGPFVEIVKSLNLPDWLVHWGHPGNMAVVLFAMGGYGTYLGFRIRGEGKGERFAPKLLAGMFFFFSLGATGGITSLLTSDKPIFERIHRSCSLDHSNSLTTNLFKDKPELRGVHGILGSGIMALFLVHAAFGLQLGLSY